jgi:hypothetical protein
LEIPYFRSKGIENEVLKNHIYSGPGHIFLGTFLKPRVERLLPEDFIHLAQTVCKWQPFKIKLMKKVFGRLQFKIGFAFRFNISTSKMWHFQTV